MSGLRLYLLGSPRLALAGKFFEIRRRKVWALLAYLAVTGQSQRRDTLASLLWPEADQSRARNAVARHLSELKKHLGDWLVIEGETVSLARRSDFWLDVDQFQGRLADCGDLSPDCLISLTEAISLYHNDFLSGFSLPDCPDYDEWQFFQREGLRQQLAAALERLIQLHGAQGDYEAAIPHARRWLALDPLHEPAQRQLMMLYAQTGQQTAALRQYQECVRLLETELGASPEDATTTLYEAIKAKRFPSPAQAEARQVTPSRLPAASPLPLRSPALRHNLPPQMTPFIGRERELSEIGQLLQNEPACRLLSLVGPGGIGKTRLAAEVAVAALGVFPDGVYFVSLASVGEAEFLISAIAESLHFTFYDGPDPKIQLLHYLRQKIMLLVLDNFEYLLAPTSLPPSGGDGGGADLLSEILLAAPQVKLLVTSRERLQLQEEWGFEVRGMAFPEAVGLPRGEALESLEAYGAVRLFVQQARRAQAGFVLTAENSPHVLRICQLVGGMPLGLELAATWVRLMSCREIAGEIAHNLDFLATSLRNMPERHRSLRVIFESSWQRLSAAEQAVFSQLSVFRGGFSREAAEQVAGASLGLLSALVDKSLLRRTRAGRYEIHELLRQYGAEKGQAAAEENEATRNIHADYYATLLQRCGRDLFGRRQAEALAEIGAEIDNVRAGWRWAVSQGNATAVAKAYLGLLFFHNIRGQLQEVMALFSSAIEPFRRMVEDTKDNVSKTEYRRVLAILLRSAAHCYLRLDHQHQARVWLQESLAILEQIGAAETRGYALSLWELGLYYLLVGNYDQANQVCQAALELIRKHEDGWIIDYNWQVGTCHLLLGMISRSQGYYESAKQHLSEGLSFLTAAGDPRQTAFCLDHLGLIALWSGDYTTAEEECQSAFRLRREVGDRLGTAFSLRHLGRVARALGQYAETEQHFQASLQICEEIGHRSGIANCLLQLGQLAHVQEDHAQAAPLLQKGLAIHGELGSRLGMANALIYLGHTSLVLGQQDKAQSYFQESLTMAENLNARWLQVEALHGMGTFWLASGDNEAAHDYFRRALMTASQLQAPPAILAVLVGLASLLAQRGDAEKAIELLALVQHHPAAEKRIRDRADSFLVELAATLPAEVIFAAQERGRTSALEAAVANLLAE